MIYKSIFFLILLLLTTSCSQIPKESVELSATVGRDLSEMHRAHRELVVLYYDRLFKDINDFVDNVYAPYQIQKTLEQYKESLFEVIQEASSTSSSAESKNNALEILGIYFEEVRSDIEDFRKTKLEPVIQQKETLLRDLDDAYEQIHYANSIVTGHLASAVKVHDTQNEILAKVKLENIRSKVSVKASDLSERLQNIMTKAQKGEEQIEKVIDEFEKAIDKLNE